MKILIICIGNSCRSQMAHGFLQSLNKHLSVFSAGVMAAGMLTPKAVAVMQEIGIDISRHTSDSVDLYLNDEWDYVITVCDYANEVCPTFNGKVKNCIHMGFHDPTFTIGTDDYIWSEFRRVRDEIKSGFSIFYEEQIKPEL